MRRRFFLDAGSGVCLWTQDAEAKARLGYRVVSRKLDIPEDLHAEIEQRATDHDATFAWDDPGSGDILAPGRTMSGYAETPLRDVGEGAAARPAGRASGLCDRERLRPPRRLQPARVLHDFQIRPADGCLGAGPQLQPHLAIALRDIGKSLPRHPP